MYKLIIIILFSSLIYSEQDTFELKTRYGGFTGFGVGFNLASFSKLPTIPNCCSEFSFTTGSAFQFGGLIDIPQDYFWGYSGRISISNFNTSFVVTEPEIINVNGVATNGEFEHSLNTMLLISNLNLGAYYNIIPKLELRGGMIIGFLLSTNYSQQEQITKPNNAGVFTDTRTRIRNNSTGSIPESSLLQLGFDLGISYQLPLDKRGFYYFYPEFSYQAYFTNIASETSWMIHSANLGVAFKYREAPPPPPPPPNPIIFNNLKMPVSPPVLTASISHQEFVEGNKKVKSLKIEDFTSFNMRPLLNYIFFEENSSEIPDRYNKLKTSQISNFSTGSLSNLNPIETYYQVLNIYGFRLLNSPNENITIIGCNSNEGLEKNNLELSTNRALSIKNYLVENWLIDSNRIKIESRNLPEQSSRSDTLTGLQENRRVEIIASKNLVESVKTFDTLRTIKDIKFVFTPKVEAPAGLKTWVLTIKNKNQKIKEFNGKSVIPKNIEWLLSSKSKELSLINDRLSYKLEIEDSLGQIYTTRLNKIAVERLSIDRKRLEKRNGKEFEYYSLILFPYGESRLAPEHIKTVEFVKTRISENSQVKIKGYSDSVGDEAINQRIATSRARAVSRVLNYKNAEVIGVGESSLLFDNSFPEGRFYCRTVRIEIETDINN